MSRPPRYRQAVRAFLVDPCDRLLLVRYEFPGLDVWCTPGGGLDEGEDPLDGLARELREETGLDLSAHDPGPCVAHRVHPFPFGEYDGQEEWYWFLRVPAFEPAGSFTVEELRAENLHELRWWSVAALREQVTVVPVGEEDLPEDGSRLTVTGPRDLPHLVAGWLADGLPARRAELGV